MQWPFYPFLSGNSGVTPPYAGGALPKSQWPFGFGDGKTRLPVPYQPKPMVAPGAPQLPVAQQPAQLPATTDYKLPVRSASGDLSKIIAMLPPALRGSFLGPAGTAATTAASVMAPTATGPETPIYIKDKGGNWVRNPDFHDTLATPPSMGPEPTDAFGSTGPTPPVPLPQPRPDGAAMAQAPAAPPAPAPSTGFNFFGPGFGAGDPNGSNMMGPGQMGQGSDIAQTNLLKSLIAKLQGQ